MKSKQVLTGRAAWPGVVTGTARVIKSYADLAHVLPGEVLIASQTDVNFVPAMAICAGLVTECGSRFCHAAITAREMQLTCVVGVEGIREVAQTGDIVTVNGDNANVTIGGQSDDH